MLAYLPILLMMLVALAVALGAMVVAGFLALSAANSEEVEREPWECGVDSDGSSLLHVPVKFYLVCLLFLLFDVETIFLIGWAVAYSEFGGTALGALYWLGAAGVFLFFLLVGLAYEWKRGALEWQ